MLASKSNDKGAGRIGWLWCTLMHNSPMWPIHGHYECRVCGRQHAVPWDETTSKTAAERHGGGLRIGEVRAA